jgi:hypothetical protein
MSKSRRRPSSGNGAMVAMGLGAVVILGLFIYAAYQNLAPKDPISNAVTATGACSPSKVTADMRPEGVEYAACKSQQHVEGAHYSGWVTPGFFGANQTPERLVHSLEHGHTVIYYDQSKLATADVDVLKALARQFKGDWDGVVVVPRKDANHAVILTAWEHALRLTEFDKAKIEQFVDVFRGRGPENPVR